MNHSKVSPQRKNYDSKKKLVVVGDSGTGKTTLIHSLLGKTRQLKYTPTVFEKYSSLFCLKNQTVLVDFFDTCGNEDFARLRPLAYPNTDLILLTFSMNSFTSLQSIEEKWAPEIHHFCESSPILLVGIQSLHMLPTDRVDFKPVSHRHANLVAKKINAIRFVECCLDETHSIQQFLKLLAKASLFRSLKRSKLNVCSIQ